jgi:hypothetical protein
MVKVAPQNIRTGLFKDGVANREFPGGNRSLLETGKMDQGWAPAPVP